MGLVAEEMALRLTQQEILDAVRLSECGDV